MQLANRISKIAILSFFALLCLLLISSELVRKTYSSKTQFNNATKVFSKLDQSKIDQIKINNRMGSLSFAYTPEFFEWKIIEPKLYPAKREIIDSIFNELKKLDILKAFQNNIINRQNFLLTENSPTLRLSSAGEVVEELQFGMNNSMNQTSYLYLKSKDIIFQVQALGIDYNTIDLPSSIESKLFSFSNKNFEYLKLFRGNEKGYELLNIFKDKKEWKGRKKINLSSEKVELFLKKLKNQRISKILDNLSQKKLKERDKIIARSVYTLSLKRNSQALTTLIISKLNRDSPALNLKKGEYLALSKENNFTYVVNSELIKLLETREKDLKGLPVKKLFY